SEASAVFGVLVVEATTGVPLRALVSVGGDASGVLEDSREMDEVPGHERRIPVREIVLWTAGSGVEVGRPRPGFADPAGVGLRRDRVADVLQRVEHVLRTVLDAVFVSGDEAAGDAAVVQVL